MKKFIAFILVVIFVLTGCGASASDVSFYIPACLYDEADYGITMKMYGKVLRGEAITEYKEIFDKICDFAGVEKEMPEIREVTTAELCEIMEVDISYGDLVHACFSRPNKIYVTKNSDIQTLAHELLHYMSTDGVVVTRGLIYEKEGYEMGRYLNEGVTDYFSYLVCEKSSLVEAPYEYERHVAECLITLFGFDVVKAAYFNSDVSELREKVNNALKNVYESQIDSNNILLDQFDIFSTSLSGYSLCLSYGGEYTGYAFDIMNSVEEMIVKMSQNLEMEDAIKTKQKEFLEAYPHLKIVARFDKMW